MDILVVDDDLAIREMLSDVLEDEGYHVVTAGNGQQALDMLRQHGARIQLVLLDLMMPVMSGWDFLQARAQNPALAAVPVLVMSASENRLQVARFISPDLFLAKPIEITLLFERVARFCGNPSLSPEHTDRAG